MKASLVAAIALFLVGATCLWMFTRDPGLPIDPTSSQAGEQPAAAQPQTAGDNRSQPGGTRARAASLTVQIVNRFDDRPIPGATVVATGIPSENEGDKKGEKKSDARGVVVFPFPTTSQNLTLTATHPSFETGSLTLRLDGDEDLTIQLELRGRGRLTGRITGAGAPLDAATISVDGASTRTDVQGRFELGGLRIAAERLVVVEKAGFATQRIAMSIGAQSNLDVDLKAAPTMQLTVSLAGEEARKLPETALPTTVRLGSHVVLTNNIYFRQGVAVQTIPWRDAKQVEVLLQTPLGQTIQATGDVDPKRRRARVVVKDLRWLRFTLRGTGGEPAGRRLKLRTAGKTRSAPIAEATQRVVLPIQEPWPEARTLRMWTAAGVSSETRIGDLTAADPTVTLGDLGGRIAVAPVPAAEAQDFELRGRRGEYGLPRTHDSKSNTLRFFVPPGDFMLVHKGEPLDNAWHTATQGQETTIDFAKKAEIAAITGQVGQQSRVVLFRRIKPESRPVELGQQDVAEDERFEFARLSPGDYLVVVKASPLIYKTVACTVVDGKPVDLGRIATASGRTVELTFVDENLRPAAQRSVSWTQRPVGKNPDLELRWDDQGRAEVTLDPGAQTALLSTMTGFGICTVPAGADSLQIIVPQTSSRTFQQRTRATVELPAAVGQCQQLCVIRKLGATLWFVMADHQGGRRFSIPKSTEIVGLLAYTTDLGAVPFDYTPGTPLRLPTLYPLGGVAEGTSPRVRLESFFGHPVPQSSTTLSPRSVDGVLSVYLARGCSAVFNTKEGVELSVRAQHP